MKLWIDHFEGNEEEAASGFIMGKMTEAIMAASANAELDEPNVLMFRYGFHSAKNAAGEPMFDLFDLLIITFVLSDRDGLYQLEVDRDFV